MPDPTARIASFTYSFDYDPAILDFRPSQTSLVCEVRSSLVDAYCPALSPGEGTTPIGSSSDVFTVDQSHLTISEDAMGLPSATLTWNAPSGVTVSGEKIFLALAFDILPPLMPGATVTYSPTALPGATFTTTAFSCKNEAGATEVCDSPHPSLSFKIDPVPAPLAVAGLPVMVHASRRLRRRVRLAAASR